MAASLWEVPPEIKAEDSFHRALRLRPAANLDAAIGENDPARRLVILVAGYFEAPQAGFAGHRQYQRQSPGRIAAPALPRHDRIADMARNVVGNIIAASHVAEIDRAAEVAVIEPEHGAGETRHLPPRGLSEHPILTSQIGQECSGIAAVIAANCAALTSPLVSGDPPAASAGASH